MVNELIIFDSYLTQMTKAKINASSRVTPRTIILKENHGSLRTMDSFLVHEPKTSKGRGIELTESLGTEKSTVLCYNPCDTSAYLDSYSQKTNVEINKYDGSEESSIGKIAEETYPAGLEDIIESREDTTLQGALSSENTCTERHSE